MRGKGPDSVERAEFDNAGGRALHGTTYYADYLELFLEARSTLQDHCPDWSVDQQKQLEAALKTHPSSTPAKERWKAIAADVEGKKMKECIARFKWVREQIANSKTATVISDGDASAGQALASSLFRNIMDVADDIDDMQLMRILEQIEEIAEELNTKLAAALFEKIGALESEHESAVGQKLCRQIGQMGIELLLESNEQAQLVSSQLVEAFTRVDKPTIDLLESTDEDMDGTNDPNLRIWAAPSPPTSADNIFSVADQPSVRVLREGFATAKECCELVGLGTVAMAGSYHRGGHCSLGVAAGDGVGSSLVKLQLQHQPRLKASSALLAEMQQRVMRQVETDHSLRPCSLVDNGGMLVRIQGADCTPSSVTAGACDGGRELDTSRPYWDVHCDKANIASWDFSALVYLNDHGLHFEGGHFAFVDEDADRRIPPVKGRLVSFRSGFENMHQVQPVTSGVRFVLALFFSHNVHVGVAEGHVDDAEDLALDLE
jgi:hypothetical protein